MTLGIEKKRAPRNRTLTLSNVQRVKLKSQITTLMDSASSPREGIICGDSLKLSANLPRGFVDLLFLDPPYNLNKSFHGVTFSKKAVEDYTAWFDRVITILKPTLRPTATVYICGDWLSSASIFEVASSHFVVQNRITWEREKGRGALSNWKNSSEDIWFCTVSDDYYFNVNAVKLRRRVLAPYTNGDGSPKDWRRTDVGNYRDTHPSNLWNDITIPFWSMPENTDHPTQKSEKLLAKLLLASSRPGNFVFDPFVGSGTSCVVAKKLGRRFLGIDLNEEYVLWTLRRLEMAESDRSIQGYTDGVFWERNTLAVQQQMPQDTDLEESTKHDGLFD